MWNTNIVGQKFNMLTVVGKYMEPKKDQSVSAYKCTKVKCLCDCGKTVIRVRHDVVYGISKSCGCYKPISDVKLYSDLYKTHTGIRQRCYNKNCPAYPGYGGRGIIVCDRWLGKDGFKNFRLDMGTKPSPKHSLDRINNNGNYEPENCRWATSREQQNNKRNNKFITYNGETRTVALWELTLGFKRGELSQRMLRFTFEEAVSVPSNYLNGKKLRTRLGIKKINTLV